MKALGIRKLKEYRELAERNTGRKGSEAILSLVSEVERLRACKSNNGEITEDTLWGWGKHKGRPMYSIPKDYFRWWLRETNVEELKIDAELGNDFAKKAVAKKKLRLHAYLTELLQPVGGKIGQ